MKETIRPVLSKVQYRKRAFFERRLPQSGELSCRVGDVVKPFDVLGSTFVSIDKRAWRVSMAEWSVKVTDGASLSSGDVLLRKKSWWPAGRAVVTMPFSGTASVGTENGVVKIDIASFPERFNLISGISARVAKIIERSSVLLETEAYVVNGVYGSGKEVIGEIKIVGSADTPLLLSQVSSDLTGKIVVGSSYVSPEVINKAQALGVSALIIGGTNPQSVRSGLPILITEGFGKVPMSREIFDFLQGSQLKTAIVSPQRRQLIVPESGGDRLIQGRPEASGFRELVEGDRVQVFVWPSFGFCGTVEDLSKKAVRFPSGITDFTAKVRLDNGGSIDVPISNIGILG